MLRFMLDQNTVVSIDDDKFTSRIKKKTTNYYTIKFKERKI